MDFFYLKIFTEEKINEKNKLSRNEMKLKSKVANIKSTELTFCFLCICIGMVSFFFSRKRQFLAFLSKTSSSIIHDTISFRHLVHFLYFYTKALFFEE